MLWVLGKLIKRWKYVVLLGVVFFVGGFYGLLETIYGVDAKSLGQWLLLIGFSFWVSIKAL